MAKRKFDELDDLKESITREIDIDNAKPAFKNSLDSDEDDDEVQEERYDVMKESDLERILNEKGGKTFNS